MLQCIKAPRVQQQHGEHHCSGLGVDRALRDRHRLAAQVCAHMRSRLWYTPVRRTVSALSP